jgi:PAS domain S-box-containing protein
MSHPFRALFNHTHDAVCMADATGRIAQANPAAVARFGLAADGGEARHLRDLFDMNIETGAVTGGMSRQALQMLSEWREQHRDELSANWKRARQRLPLQPIPPLR